MRRPTHLVLLPLLMAVSALAAEPGPALPKKSPFELRGAGAPPAAAANETIEFAGVSSIGKKTDLIFYDKTAKKSHWIAQGETKEGISVVNYDQQRESVVVKINGVEKTLALRKGGGTANAPRPVTPLPGGFNTPLPAALPVPVPAQIPVPPGVSAPGATGAEAPSAQNQPAPPPGSPAEIQKKQETEARMLVSDLLEIGMAQRRAYEEAQRKAAEGTPQNAAPDPAQPASNQPPR